MERIASRDNERVKHTCKLAASSAFRAQEGLFVAEGKRLCFDLAKTLRPKTAFYTEKFLSQNPQAARLAEENFIISQPVDDKLACTKTPQGVYCVFETPAAALAEVCHTGGILVCEAMQNPANVGAVLRSAAAFGLGGVVLLQGSADPFSPKALRASMGAVGRVPLVRDVLFEEVALAMQAKGVTLYAAALQQGARPLNGLKPAAPFALVVGNEGVGLSPQVLASGVQTVYIPMQNGVESLNAAVAASVLMFHFKQVCG